MSAIIPPPAPETMKLDHQGFASIILPHILLWDPLHQFSRCSVLCPQCSQPLKTAYWKWGQSAGSQPRKIHCIEYIVIIIPAVYSCAHDHLVVANDPRILRVLTLEQQPFVLLHRTGFTKHFINTVVQLFQEGMTIAKIEQYILKSRENYIADLYLRVKSFFADIGTSLTTTTSPLNLIRFPAPSNDVLCKCFVAYFLDNKKYYDHLIQQLGANYISFDHTFKTASNIGYLRSDGKWVNQYNSVFFVMNEVGQIIAWQLTRSTSLDEVELLLANLATRLRKESVLPIYVDNCCLLREKLAGIMGSNIVVKLDLFHAIQRITRSIPKRHPFFLQCMADLKLVLRQPTDLGFIRHLPTPDPEVINANLETFLNKWEKVTFQDSCLITGNTKVEISALKKHVTKGCLSGIPKGAGTTRNEAFHRVLNTHFGRVSRIGIPLALALLTVMIYQHNCKVQEKVTDSPPLSITLAKERFGNEVQMESFGVVRKDEPDKDSWIACKIDDDIKPKNFPHESEIKLTDVVAKLITPSNLVKVFKSACNLANIVGTMKKVTANSPMFKPSLLPFMSSVSNIILSSHPDKGSSSASEHEQRLNDVVSSCKFKLFPISGDGNCLFSAVAFSLLQNKNYLIKHDQNFFVSRNLEADRDRLRITLRKLAVLEWKNNEDIYKGFLTSNSTSVTEEADKFLEGGYYNSELGDTMVTALANGLELVIVVLTSIDNYPIMNIVPRHTCTPVTLYVAFNQSGAGHYDGLVPAEEVETPQLPKDTNASCCTCGRSDKKNNTHCHPKQRKYTTVCTCSCYNSKISCSARLNANPVIIHMASSN